MSETHHSRVEYFISRARKIRMFLLAALASWLAALTPAAAEEEHPLPPGAYRLEMILASTTRVPVFGSSKSASKSVSLVEIRGDGAKLIQSHKVCDFRVLEDSKLIKMIFPEKFVAALANHSYPIELEKNGEGWSYRADLGVERIGYRAGSAEDKLPLTVDNPAVFDWDGDGHPGATLKISIPLLPDGELYVVQRGHSVLNGRLVQPGKIEGNIDVRNFEQRVLDAWPGFLATTPEITPDPKESRFVLTAIPAGTTCAAIRATVPKP